MEQKKIGTAIRTSSAKRITAMTGLILGCSAAISLILALMTVGR